MTWTRSEVQYGLLQKLCLHAIKYGPIPKHVAFIMDGNRRFADSKIDELKEDDICIRVIGNLALLPAKVQSLAAQLMLVTRNHSKSILNICMAYNSRNDITNAMEIVRLGVKEGKIIPSDITQELLSKCLYTRLSKPLDLLIRTSGEIRLSDFLTWQPLINSKRMMNNKLNNIDNDDSMNNNFILNRIHSNENEAHQQRINSFLDYLDQTFWQNMTSLATSF
ncbi:unnamed protein product [Schistosoma curassoni]|uniref:ditrans,polycis-polyprenyl diphosphate synthase [(2E,6E)-farnesyldiphosphate specific] n=1 Tax=Schistosoma curassoni TaxID=6186 RepID=A0A183KNZ8_9TREM|nr:unnamed protein product [Schistosoma curassoni]